MGVEVTRDQQTSDTVRPAKQGNNQETKQTFILEIRVSQNLARLGGEAHKGWEDRREMK